MHRHHRHRGELGQEDHDWHRERRADKDQQEDERGRAAEPSRQGSLASRRVGLHVPQVVEDEHRRRHEPNSAPHQHGNRGDAADLDIDRADGRDEAEEHEHEKLAQAEVAVRPRPAGVEPAREEARRADQEQAPVDGEAHRDARDGRDAEGGDGRPPHASWVNHS